jgi:septal ring factor EnvC (AmiA/AmiB activator)
VIGWISNLIPPQYRILAALIIAGILIGVGSVAGWKARDYFADRKELKRLENELALANKNAGTWKETSEKLQSAIDSQNTVSAQMAAQRDEATALANKASAEAFAYKDKLTRLEAAREEDHGMCERTAPCHWLRLNAAYTGIAAPAECAETGSVQD